MTGTNHFLTGSLIGLTVHQPVLAITLAFGSHFLLDSLPHYGDDNHTGKKFLAILAVDAMFISIALGLFALTQPVHWPLAIACGLAASSPDLMWLPNWLNEMRGHGKQPLNNMVERFHKRIQWGEKPKYWPVEIVWTAFMALALVNVAKF